MRTICRSRVGTFRLKALGGNHTGPRRPDEGMRDACVPGHTAESSAFAWAARHMMRPQAGGRVLCVVVGEKYGVRDGEGWTPDANAPGDGERLFRRRAARPRGGQISPYAPGKKAMMRGESRRWRGQ